MASGIPRQQAAAAALQRPVRVVAVGASAGGIEALHEFFRGLRPSSGEAYVLVLHLAADFKSELAEIVSRWTELPVVTLHESQSLRADTVHVLAPGLTASITGHRIVVTPLSRREPVRHNIDDVFESLAGWQQAAAAIVLSGSGQDGCRGAGHVAAQGGLVLAQSPASARFASMPHAALSAGHAQLAVEPQRMGLVLQDWQRLPLAQVLARHQADTDDAVDPNAMQAYAPLLEALREVFDVDFAAYKEATLLRRFERWKQLEGAELSPQDLAQRVRADPARADALISDLLIGVTGFLRDAEAFDALRQLVIEPAVRELPPGDEYRVWCCGCSTGEEAYSVAMLVHEAFEAAGLAPRLRLHATDLHPRSVQRAAAGLYDDDALSGLPPAWRAKYFVPQPSGLHRVADELRRSLVFTAHNVLRDAAFPRLHLVVCRNLLIYLRPAAQSRVLGSFFISLRDGGALFLGRSESPARDDAVFECLDEAAHLHRKRPGTPLPPHMRPQFSSQRVSSVPPPGAQDAKAQLRLYELMLKRFVACGFLVNQSEELIYVFGDAGRLLAPVAGSFSPTLHNLLSGPLRTAISLALPRAAHSDGTVRLGDAIHDPQRPDQLLRIEVDRLADSRLPQTCYLVRLEPQAAPTPETPRVSVLDPESATARHIAELEAELQRTRDQLRLTIEELEGANEQLQASNEELQAGNEELQTANEELQALNEELYSMHAEHELKIAELRETTNDLNNLMRTADVAIIFLDAERRIRLFTPPAAAIFPLRPVDLGRDLKDLVPLQADPQLFADLAQVQAGSEARLAEVAASGGRTLQRRASVYRAGDGQADGLVLTYLDITTQLELKARAFELQRKSQLDAIIASVPNLLWTCDSTGACDFLSPQWVAYTGVEPSGQLAQGWLEHVHPDDRAATVERWADAVTHRGPFRTRYRLRRADGAYRWFDVRAAATRDESGRVSKWFGACTDAHDAVELQLGLEARDAFVRMVADNINGMVGYWDKHQRNRFANRHYLAWFGRSQERMQGATLAELMGPELYKLNQPYIERALAGEPQRFERQLVRPDGAVGYVLAEYAPHVVDGQVEGFLATVTDITRIQEQRLLIEEVFRASPLAKLVVGPDGRIINCNPAAETITQYDAAALRSMSVEDLVPEEMRGRHAALRQGFALTSERRPMGSAARFPLRRADGSIVYVDIELAGITVAGRPGSVVYLRPGNVEAEHQRRTDAALQARSAFLAQMSHEIRTPLNAVLGMVQLLMLEAPSARQLDRLNRIEEASTHLLAIIDDILDLSKMEAGRMAIHPAPFKVGSLVDQALEMVADRAKVKSLALSSKIAETVPAVLVGDARRIEQILVNFLTNAVKYTPSGAVALGVSCFQASGERLVLHFEVTDTGIGIDPTLLPSLFVPFHQVEQGHSRRFSGVGLGLAISRQLARAMNGECGARSSPGQGSTFWCNVQVGLTDQDAHVPSGLGDLDEAHADELHELCGERRVLLVEDDEVNRIVAVELFHVLTGVQPLTAADGQEALDMASQAAFDLVLMDIQLPGIDGLEATRRLRTLPGYAEVPVYALSANVLAEDVNACLEAGMNGHLGKPIRAQELISLILRLWGPQPLARDTVSAPL